jgi:membrane protein
VGAAVTSLLFVVGKAAIGLYLGNSGVASVYGAASSLVVILVWVYYTSQILFLGAEFTQVFARRRGRAVGAKP